MHRKWIYTALAWIASICAAYMPIVVLNVWFFMPKGGMSISAEIIFNLAATAGVVGLFFALVFAARWAFKKRRFQT